MDGLRVVTTTEEARALSQSLLGEALLAVDVESDGLFAYRARVCTVQLGWGDRVAVVDALTADVTALAELLGEGGPVKIVHDVGFDARVLAEAGVAFGNVHDTSI